MMTHTSERRTLIKTTARIGQVLSRDFGLRNGYQVVGTTASACAKATIQGGSERAAAVKRFLERQTPTDTQATDRNPSIHLEEAPGLGDLVLATKPGTTQRIRVLIVSRVGRHIQGVLVVTSSETILRGVMDDNEVFVTSQRVTIGVDAIVTKIDARGVVLRRAWIPELPAFTGLAEWAAEIRDDEVQYHDGDFVLLGPRDGARLMDVVQIHRLRNLDVVIRRLHRQASTSSFKHDRLLVPDREFLRIDRRHFKPIAKCYVTTLVDTPSSWLSEATDFFVTEESAQLLRPPCDTCTMAKRQDRRSQRAMKPLRAMELMCGAGGLTLGLDLSGACETTFAMDADAHAVETFRRHHPNAKILCVDAGDALEQAMSPNAENSLPRPGDIDVIAVGPPCQGFSRKNQTAARDAAEKDPRNLLVCTVLGWVDHLRPKYFVLENVEGFTASKLGGHDQGMVKLVLAALLKIGYAATWGFVQSGAYGCAQSRGRFILLAARQDLTLPKLPQPTHDFQGRSSSGFWWSDASGQHTSRVPSMPILPALSVADAIDDLAVFDWRDPHQTYEGPDAIELERERAGIAQLEVASSTPAGFASTPYATPPNTSYQQRMRAFGSKIMTRTRQHQTSGYSAIMVERVVNVALDPGSTYDSWSLPSVNKPALLSLDQVRIIPTDFA